ncbi:MAG: guanitoxin biosynthesis heme-dependent pre-guanitoxin N-hydroxylase GntA [Bacteroidota bacterium]
MRQTENDAYIEQYKSFLHRKEYPCVAAKAAVQKQQVRVFVADHMACPKDDRAILDFMYNFVDEYRNSEAFFHSAAVIFKGHSEMPSEEGFEAMLFQRLQSLANIGSKEYAYDKRVSSDPTSKDFSFSIKEEAFYIIGLHPHSNRAARQFMYPTMVFNPHQQFQDLRKTQRYDKMKKIVRKLDTAYSGSVNPMLQDFGSSPEVFQYSGRKLDQSWQCPLKINNQIAGEQH